jgi:hypothetical protein
VALGEELRRLGYRYGDCSGIETTEVDAHFVTVLGARQPKVGRWIFKYRPRSELYGMVTLGEKEWTVEAYGPNGAREMAEVVEKLKSIAAQYGIIIRKPVQTTQCDCVEQFMSDVGP